MAMRHNYVIWVFAVATITLVAVLVILEANVFFRHARKVSCGIFSGYGDAFGSAQNAESEELDDLISRRNRLASMCKKYEAQLAQKKVDTRASWRLPFCDRELCSFHLVKNRRFGFCPIPKAATSSLKTLILATENSQDLGNDPDNIFNAFKARFPSVAPSLYWEKKLGSEYTKLIVVRHPFERLVSAYVDKILTTHPSIPGAKAMYKGGFIGKGTNGTFTFGEFVSNILKLSDNNWDAHWAPFTPRCSPCSMRYDVIVKVETLHKDLVTVLPRVGLENWTFPKRNLKAHARGTRQRTAAEYFSELSRREILQLYAIYMYDFELFGYKLQGYTEPVL